MELSELDVDRAEKTGHQVFRMVGMVFAPVGFLFLLIGLATLVFGWFSLKSSQAAKNWPSVEGRVLEREIKESVTEDSDGYEQELYQPIVHYEYYVDGKNYSSNKLTPTFQQSYSQLNDAEQVLVKYPEGSKVDVFYDPEQPESAALEVEGGAAGSWLAMILGGIFGGLGLILGLLGVFLARKFKSETT